MNRTAEVAKLVELEIAPDALHAYFVCKQDLPDLDSFPEPSFFLQYMLNNGVIYGVKKKLFAKKAVLFEALTSHPRLLIAQGEPARIGQKGFVSYFFDTDNKRKQTPRPQAKGGVNFRELSYVSSVPAGFLLAQVFAPQQVRKGMDVFGREIVPDPAHQVQLRHTANVTVSGDGGKFFAKCAGAPVLNDGVLDVLKKISIEGNVNYTIGNVRFVGDLEILGNVEQGFFVEAGKSILIEGNAIGGSIVAGGDLRVANGIISADRNSINVVGSITARFIENSRVSAGRDITVDRWLLHDRLECGGLLRVGVKGEGMIMGGSCRAGIGVIACELGTDIFAKTSVSVHYHAQYYHSDELYSHFLVLNREHHLLTDIIQKAYNNIEDIKNSSKINMMQKADLIDEYTEKIFESHKRKKALEEDIVEFRGFLRKKQYILDPLIIATRQVWPGVEVNINGTMLKIRKPMGPTVFGYEDGKVTVSKLEERQDELHWLY